MKRKILMLLATCSLAIVIIVPVVTVNPVIDSNYSTIFHTNGHGSGGD